jgi:hypothetical protein
VELPKLFECAIVNDYAGSEDIARVYKEWPKHGLESLRELKSDPTMYHIAQLRIQETAYNDDDPMQQQAMGILEEAFPHLREYKQRPPVRLLSELTATIEVLGDVGSLGTDKAIAVLFDQVMNDERLCNSREDVDLFVIACMRYTLYRPGMGPSLRRYCEKRLSEASAPSDREFWKDWLAEWKGSQ